jgi:hypothetical protein
MPTRSFPGIRASCRVHHKDGGPIAGEVGMDASAREMPIVPSTGEPVLVAPGTDDIDSGLLPHHRHQADRTAPRNRSAGDSDILRPTLGLPRPFIDFEHHVAQ